MKMSLDEQFELLRARVEAAVEFPALVLVSSALPGDGKSVTALGLAESLGDSGYRVAVIDADQASENGSGPASLDQFLEIGPSNFARKHPDDSFVTIGLSRESLRRNASRRAINRTVEALLQTYEFVIIDAGLMLESNLVTLLAKAADAVLFAVREGRGVKRADRDLVRACELEGIVPLGTVSVSPAAIREAARRFTARAASPRNVASPVDAAAARRQRVLS